MGKNLDLRLVSEVRAGGQFRGTEHSLNPWELMPSLGDSVRIELNCRASSCHPENCLFWWPLHTHAYFGVGNTKNDEFLSVLYTWKECLLHIWAIKRCVRGILLLMLWNLSYFYWYFICIFCTHVLSYVIKVCLNQYEWRFPLFFSLGALYWSPVRTNSICSHRDAWLRQWKNLFNLQFSRQMQFPYTNPPRELTESSLLLF